MYIDGGAMLEQVKFMETLRAVADVARVSTTPLSKEEINEYFDGMELTQEQQELVYQYLLNPQEDDIPEQSPVIQDETEDDAENEVEEPLAESMFLKMYKEEIQEIKGLTLPQESEAYIRLVDGDSSVIESISEHWLVKVVDIAKDYAKHNVNMEDMIQEGNIGLIMGLQNLLGTKKRIDVEEYLKESVQKAIEDYIDEMNMEDDWESTVVAKTTLIHEAKLAMAKDLGRMPDVHELSNFTKISVEEIEDILKLSSESEK